MLRRISASVFIYGAALTVSVAAQQDVLHKPPAKTERPSDAQATSADPSKVTVEGCLRRETDVPGRATPEQEQARTESDDDYVLTDTSMIRGLPPQAPDKEKTDAKPTGTSGKAPASLMFKVKGDDLKLGDHVGRRVQIDGLFEHEKRAANPVGYEFDLVKLNGTAIKDVSQTCEARK